MLPRSVSFAAPPSTVMSMSAARFPVALKLSSPPLAFRTSFSEVPMSIANGAGLRRSKRTRVPLAVVVNCSAPFPPLTSTVSIAVAALVEVGVVAGVPDHPVVAALAEDLVVGVAAGQRVVLAAAEQQVGATASEQGVVAALTGELVAAGAAGEGVVAAAAEQVGRRQRAVGLVEGDHVAAALAEDPDQRGVGNRRRAADDGDRAAVDQELPGRVAADGDRVVQRIAESRSARRR